MFLPQNFFSQTKLRTLPVVLDQAQFFPIFQKYFDCVLAIDEYNFQKTQPILLVSTSIAFSKTELKKILDNHHATIFLLPLAKHLLACHPDEDKMHLLDYTLRALQTLDAKTCMQWVSTITAQVQPHTTLRIHHAQTWLLVQVHSINRFACPTELKPGDLFSPFLLCEYGLLQSLKKLRFEINGTFSFSNMLVSAAVESQYVTNHKNQLLSLIRHSRHCMMTIKNTHIESLKIDDQEYIAVLDGMGVSRKIVEVAFGVNQDLNKNFDRMINSPINEGVFGMHVGVGTGKNQYHVDFISADTNFTHCTIG